MAVLDYKKQYKDLYMPKDKPIIIEVPEINFVAVRGKGNPNDPNGEYAAAVSVLYAISYTIKMSKVKPEGYFEYVVPPLEGLWQMTGIENGIDYMHKEDFDWISLIRLPEFVTKEIFDSAAFEAAKKKKLDTSKAEFFTYTEGLCVQCMHFGAFDDEPATVKKIEDYINENGLKNGITENRRHHEIYLSDPRKTLEEKRKTVLRIPIEK